MSRRLSIAALVFALASTWATAAEPMEGRDYFPVKADAAPPPGARPVVTYYFSYYCGHCQAVQPALEAWFARLKDSVDVVRVVSPTSFAGMSAEPTNRTLHALALLPEARTLDAAIYRAIHRDGRRFASQEAFRAWFAETRRASLEDYVKAYDSFGTAAKERRSLDWLRFGARVDFTALPTLIVDGRHWVYLDPGRIEERLAVADALTRRALEARQRPALSNTP